MILVDTNLISELMRLSPARDVLDWFGRRDAIDLYFSAVGEAELRRSAAILPEGNRHESLMAKINAMISEELSGQLLHFDRPVAVAFDAIFADHYAVGRLIGFLDYQIVAIAGSRDLALATRNPRHLEDIGLDIVNL